MTTKRPLRVFLCHSSNDKPAVRELYQKLRAEAENWIDPWLDKMKILPGQNWRIVIEEAVEASDIVIICLSDHSVDKEGFVQREIRYAYDLALEKPDGVIFLIPLRLDECEVPRGMRSYHWVDYFGDEKEEQYSNLLKAMRLRHKQKLSDEARESQAKSLTYETPAPNRKPELEEKPVLGDAALQEKQKISAPNKDQKSVVEKKVVFEMSSTEKKSKPVQQKPIIETPQPALPNKITLSNGMEFMHVPAGKFLMGTLAGNPILDFLNTSDSEKAEKPQHTVEISYNYWMARFPVTNEQYNEYIKSKRIKHPVGGWEKKNNHPVTFVTWTDAMNYCQWLNDLLVNELPLGLILRLPTEAEWEKAARGTDGREYPWGNIFDEHNCNAPESPSEFDLVAVGMYSSHGDSPFSCEDMAGNVWEWTHSLFKKYPYNFMDGREDEKADGRRVARGGYLNYYARCAHRGNFETDSKSTVISLRVVLGPKLP